jgi:hypothetical protein
MSETEFTSDFESVLFQVRVDSGVEIELRFTYLSRTGVCLIIIAPDEFAGSTIGLPNIPYFAMPSFFGYYHKGRLTSKCTAYIAESTRLWYAQRRTVIDRLPEIREYLDAGLSMQDVEDWVRLDTRTCFRHGEFQRMVHRVGSGRGTPPAPIP